MTITSNATGAGKKRAMGAKRGPEEGAKYTRYTKQQIEALEKVYGETPNPKRSQRAKIRLEHPDLNGIDDKQLKVWFQNRRCRQKQKKENGELLEENKRLAQANKVFREENDYLQNKVTKLLYDYEFLRNQFLNSTSTANTTATADETETATAITTTVLGLVPKAKSPQPSIMIADHKGLLFLAEETRHEFLSKTTGTDINWKTILTLKLPTPSSFGAIYISETCIGVAARACTIIPFEPIKIIEILKDRVSWSRNCRNVDVLAHYPSENGGTIELICTQYYSPTTMACARDFWTLRYTSVLDDGSFLVCEKSISGSDAVPSSPAALEFVRGRMLASGYLIRACEEGSLLDIVEHFDLEASSVPEVIRPLYKSSELVAKTIVAAIRYIENMASEKNDKGKHAYCEGPAFRRSFSQRLSRGFNDAINGFAEDGWTLKNADASDDVIISFNRKCEDYANYDSVICVKASLLLKNVIPAKLVTLLNERRSSWMNFNFADHSSAYTGAASFPFPGTKTHDLSETAVLLGHTNYEDEVLEVIRFKRVTYQDSVSLVDLYHLQISNGMEDGFGACSELIFAPIDRSIPNDAALLCSGFRVFLLGSNTNDGQETWSSSYSASNGSSVHGPSTMVILAFQFPCETHLQDEVALMAQKYIQHVISSVKIISLEIMLSGSNPALNSTEVNPAMGPASNPYSIFAAMNSIEGSPDIGPAITEDSIYAAMNSTESSLVMGPATTQDSIYDVMNSIEGSPAMWPSITLDSVYDAMDSIESSLPVWSAITPDSTYAAMNSIESSLAMWPAITPDSTYAAMNCNEESPAMEAGITPDSTYVAMNPAEANTSMGPAIAPDSTFDVILANLIYESYRSNLGVEMVDFNPQSNNSLLELINHHHYALVCFSFSSIPVCLYANKAGLTMLETTVENLPSLMVDKILGGSSYGSLISILPIIMEQGYAILPPGYCVSEMDHYVSYEQAIVWEVKGQDGSIHCLAFAFNNWSFF